MARTPQQRPPQTPAPAGSTPRRESRAHERSLALFVAGIVAFTPPLLMVFDRPVLVLGVPLLFLYLFAVWGVLILAAGRVAERWRRRPPPAGEG